MTAAGSTIFSLLPLAVTLRLFFEMTATTENTAPAGFQHLVQPQAWLNATLPLSATVTCCEAHLQTSVPPAKSFAPRPLSIDGCSERAICVFPLVNWKKAAYGPFFRLCLRLRRQKARFLPPEFPRSYARAAQRPREPLAPSK